MEKNKGGIIMLTYFITGVIVQIAILIERRIRIPEIWEDVNLTDADFWFTIAYCCTINALLWPASIIVEVWLLKEGL
jgi:hypothetical protein